MWLAVRSYPPLAGQIEASVATGLVRQLVAPCTVLAGSGFGLAVRDAMDARATFLEGEGLARRQGERLVMTSGLIDTLRQRDLDAAHAAIAARKGRDQPEISRVSEWPIARSEEHTSELQSLMRISYAVLCLK